MKSARAAVLLVATFVSTLAFAADPDPATLYEVRASAAPSSLQAGQKGTFVVSIHSKEGAHVSQEAPLKLVVSGKNVTPEKTKLVMADSLVKPAAGEQYADPKFEIPFVAKDAGKGSVDAKLTFFICTDTVCARQQKTLSAAVDVK